MHVAELGAYPIIVAVIQVLGVEHLQHYNEYPERIVCIRIGMASFAR